jgi:hypothetical protein
MQLTISLNDSLAAQLRRQASAKDLSPEQAARDFLGHALHRIAEEEVWRESSQRRAELIQKSRIIDLTAEEGSELDRLQTASDQRLDGSSQSLDNRMKAKELK